MSDKDTASGFAIGFIVGAAIGLAAGLLYAPRPGEETRELLREKAAGVKDKAAEVAEMLFKNVSRKTSRRYGDRTK